MHQFRNARTVVHLWVGSYLLVLGLVAGAVLIPVMAYGLIKKDWTFISIGMALAGVVLVARLVQWILSHRVLCPLCLGHVLRSQSCNPNAKARKILGSYRLAVALGVLFEQCFICPYCGESCECATRESRRSARENTE